MDVRSDRGIINITEKVKRATELYSGRTWDNVERIEMVPDGVSSWLWKLEK